MGKIAEFFGFETKNQLVTTPVVLPNRPVNVIRSEIAADGELGGLSPIQLSAVFACARVIAEGLAQVPCILQRRGETGGYAPASDHPLYDLLNRAPNKFMTAFEFREWMGFRLALLGNCYVFVIRDFQNRPIELLPIAEHMLAIDASDPGEIYYRLNGKIYDNRTIWHVKGASMDALTGMAPQKIAARAIGLAEELETFGTQLFRNGSRPSGLITTDQKLDKDQYEMLVKAWNDNYSGLSNAHKTAFLTDGLSFQSMQTSANDAQFIEARRYQTEEICRVMRVIPIMVMQATDSASYGSAEQFFLAHLTHTLQPWIERFTQSAEVHLLTRDEQRKGYRVHMDTRSISLGTSMDRATYYASMRQNGLMTINECRDHAGLDRSDDPLADKLTPSANLFGVQNPAAQPTA